MNKEKMYDQFSDDYDRFVNWKDRLANEIPFLRTQLVRELNDGVHPISVLDAACGTGQHVIALTKHGFNCAGADVSANMVRIARRNGIADNVDIPFVQAGFGQLSSAFGNQKFDNLICLGNSLPHILDEAEMMRTLDDFKAVLRPGGKLIIQNRNFDSVINTHNRWMSPETYREGNQTWIFVRFYDFDPDGLITFNFNTLTKQAEGEYQQRMFSTRLWPFTKNQMITWLKNAGFRNIRLYGDLQSAAFDIENSPNLVVTACS